MSNGAVTPRHPGDYVNRVTPIFKNPINPDETV